MSLKAFHFFFVAVSILLSVVLGAWGIRDYLGGGGTSSLVLGIVGFVAACVLIAYGARVRQKLKDLGDES